MNKAGSFISKISIGIGGLDIKNIQLAHFCANLGELFWCQVRSIAECKRVAHVTWVWNGFADLFVDGNAALLQALLGLLRVRDNDAEVPKGTSHLGRARNILPLDVKVGELNLSGIVIFEADQLLGGLVAGSVLTTGAVAKVGDGETLSQMVGEHVAHTKDPGVKVDAPGEVVDV